MFMLNGSQRKVLESAGRLLDDGAPYSGMGQNEFKFFSHSYSQNGAVILIHYQVLLLIGLTDVVNIPAQLGV